MKLFSVLALFCSLTFRPQTFFFGLRFGWNLDRMYIYTILKGVPSLTPCRCLNRKMQQFFKKTRERVRSKRGVFFRGEKNRAVFWVNSIMSAITFCSDIDMVWDSAHALIEYIRTFCPSFSRIRKKIKKFGDETVFGFGTFLQFDISSPNFFFWSSIWLKLGQNVHIYYIKGCAKSHTVSMYEQKVIANLFFLCDPSRPALGDFFFVFF